MKLTKTHRIMCCGWQSLSLPLSLILPLSFILLSHSLMLNSIRWDPYLPFPLSLSSCLFVSPSPKHTRKVLSCPNSWTPSFFFTSSVLRSVEYLVWGKREREWEYYKEREREERAKDVCVFVSTRKKEMKGRNGSQIVEPKYMLHFHCVSYLCMFTLLFLSPYFSSSYCILNTISLFLLLVRWNDSERERETEIGIERGRKEKNISTVFELVGTPSIRNSGSFKKWEPEKESRKNWSMWNQWPWLHPLSLFLFLLSSSFFSLSLFLLLSNQRIVA